MTLLDRPRVRPWVPASVTALRHYSAALFRRDLVAGITTGLVALPRARALCAELADT